MILPAEDASGESEKQSKPRKAKPPPASRDREPSWTRSEASFTGSTRSTLAEGSIREKKDKARSQKPLFTVKPGGIAGYLCAYSSYVILDP